MYDCFDVRVKCTEDGTYIICTTDYTEDGVELKTTEVISPQWVSPPTQYDTDFHN